MSVPLERVGIFSELSEPEVERLREGCETISFKAGTRIIADGARGEGLYILLSGTASVLKFSGSKIEIELARLHPGEHFGEMSLASDKPASASVRAMTDLTCLFASRDRFDRILRENPDIARKVLTAFVKTLSVRLAEIDRHYAAAIKRARRREAVRHVVHLSSVELGMLVSYSWIWLRTTVLKRPYALEKLSSIHQRHARRFKQLASHLKGATVKMAQFASLQQHLLPAEYTEEFKTLRDRVAPSEYPLVAGSIQAELGAGPLEIFADFDRAPLAAASMGQVHRATLRTGERVVVKLLHPGVERSVAIDLWITKMTLRVLNLFVRRLDLMQIFRESEEPMLNELDLLQEARSTEELGKLLKPLGVGVPKVYWQYSTRRVLTLEYIEGVTVDDVERMKAWNVDRVALARTYLRAFLHQSLTGGFFHADPHPANAFCTKEGKLVLLDFGMVKRLPDHIRRGLMKEWMGAFFNNPRMYVDGVIEKGAVGEADREFLEKSATRVFADERVRQLVFGHVVTDESTISELAEEGLGILKQLTTFKMPQDELMFLRGLGICFDAVKEIVPELSLMEVAEPIYAEVFQRVIAENPEYASGPFRIALRDADVVRLVEPMLARRGFRDLSLSIAGGMIHAEARYPVKRFGLGDVRVRAAAVLQEFDAAEQIISLQITDLQIEGDDGGRGQAVIDRLQSLAMPMARFFVDGASNRGMELSWGRLEFCDGAQLPVGVHIRVSAFAALTKQYPGAFRLDEVTMGDGQIVIARHETSSAAASPAEAPATLGV